MDRRTTSTHQALGLHRVVLPAVWASYATPSVEPLDRPMRKPRDARGGPET